MEGAMTPTTDKVLNDDDLPLAERLKALQKKRAEELQTKEFKKISNGVAPVKKEEDPEPKATKSAPKKSPADSKKSSSSEDVQKKEAVVKVKKEEVKVKKEKKEVKVKQEKKEKEIKVKVKADPIKIKPDPHGSHGKNVNGGDGGSEDGGNEDGEEEYRWWEQDNDGSIKWTTLEHNGLFFPPKYQPHGVKMHYDGQPIDLEPEAEEVATFFAGVLGTDHEQNPIFRSNFFEDFCALLQNIGSKWHGHIRELEKCDFSHIATHLANLREQRKAMTKEQKEQLKAEKKAIEDKFGWCLLDGRKEKVGNFRVEPPGLFRGRGKHPKAGKLKTYVHPEQITINIGEGAPIPQPPEGHSWGKIVHDNTVSWLATWTENVNKNTKYVFLAASSSLKGQSDLRKFEVARELKNHVDTIRKVNQEELRSKEMLVRQRATALWLIDRLALRAGNEKGDDEADTVGCCSLRCEHIRLQQPNIVIFDFLGKDSIRYYNEVPVDPIIFKNLGIFMREPKVATDPIFDRLTTSSLNKYLSGLMPGLTAKVFRTFNASHTFQVELDKTPQEGTVPELVLSYNRANRQVAILCNHQRTVPKTHQQALEKLSEKILTLKYERHLVRKELLEAMGRKELKSTLPEALDDESDMDEETIQRKEKEALAAEKEKYEKKMKKLEEEEEFNSASQDRKRKLPPPPDSPSKTRKLSPESLQKKYANLSQRINALRNQKIDKDENKTTALGTSKTNYLDPRITVAWCKKYGVPLEKLFPKTLREKFKWATFVDGEWRF